MAQELGDSGNVAPILIYHRLGAVVEDSMTVKTSVFAAHLEYLQANGYTVIPLRCLIAYIAGEAPPPPVRSVGITADDGHKSVFTSIRFLSLTLLGCRRLKPTKPSFTKEILQTYCNSL
jgi:hypothetical protein